MKTIIHLASAASFKGLSAVAAILLTIVVTRTATPAEAGSFLWYFSLCSVLAVIFRFGLDNAVLKEFSAKGVCEQANSTLYKSCLLVLSVQILFLPLLYLVAQVFLSIEFSEFQLSEAMIYMVFSAPLLSILFIFSGVYQSQHKIGKSTVFQNLGPSGLFVILVIILYLYYGHALNDTVFSKIYFISTVMLCGWIILVWLRRVGFIHLGNIEWAELLKSSSVVWMSAMLGLVVQWGGVIFVGWEYSDENVAYYSAAQRVSTLLTFLLMINTMVMTPKFARLWHQREEKKLAHLVKRSSRVLMLLVIPISLLVMLYSKEIMTVFGEGYSDYSMFLVILCVGQTLNVSAGSVAQLLNMTGNESGYRRAAFFSSLLLMLLIFPLSELFGVAGVAAASAIGMISQNFIALYIARRKLGFWPL